VCSQGTYLTASAIDDRHVGGMGRVYQAPTLLAESNDHPVSRLPQGRPLRSQGIYLALQLLMTGRRVDWEESARHQVVSRRTLRSLSVSVVRTRAPLLSMVWTMCRSVQACVFPHSLAALFKPASESAWETGCFPAQRRILH